MTDRADSDHPRYVCSSCDYEGSEYALTPSSNILNGSTKHEIAVCPECHGGLRLWVVQKR